jgi:hypothetical protein
MHYNIKKVVRLTEEDLHRIVRKSVNRVLNESANSKRAHRQSMKIIADSFGLDIEDPKVKNIENQILNTFFSDGFHNDRIIVLEPTVCGWFTEIRNTFKSRAYQNIIRRIISLCNKYPEFIHDFKGTSVREMEEVIHDNDLIAQYVLDL